MNGQDRRRQDRRFFSGAAPRGPRAPGTDHPHAEPGLAFRRGDATTPVGPGRKIIAHVCNNRGAWEGRFSGHLGQRWPRAETAYRQLRHTAGGLELGTTHVIAVAPTLWVAHMIAQDGLRNPLNRVPLRYVALRHCLERVASHAIRHAASVHLPRIGAGLAGGDWPAIETLIRHSLVAQGVAVTVYDLPR